MLDAPRDAKSGVWVSESDHVPQISEFLCEDNPLPDSIPWPKSWKTEEKKIKENNIYLTLTTTGRFGEKECQSVKQKFQLHPLCVQILCQNYVLTTLKEILWWVLTQFLTWIGVESGFSLNYLHFEWENVLKLCRKWEENEG